MVNITTRPASGSVEFDGSVGSAPTPAATTIGYVWASGTNNASLYYTDGGGTTTSLLGESPGGNNTELQYNNGGSFGGIDDLKWDGDKLLLGDSSDTGNYLLVEGSNSENTYTVFEGKRKYPRIRLTDTSYSKTQDIWLLNSQLRIGSNGGTAGNAAMIVHNGDAGNVTFNGNVGIGTTSPNQPLHVLTSANDEGILIDVSDDTHEGRLLFGDTSSNAVGHIGYNHSLNAMRFFTDSAERARLDATDGLRVNKLTSLSNATYGFQSIGSTSSFVGSLQLAFGNDLLFGSTLTKIQAGSDAIMDLKAQAYTFVSGSTHLASLTDTGLGIGTTSPSTKLHVVGDALIDGYLHADKDGSPGLLVGEGGDADIYYDGTDMHINAARVGSGVLEIDTGVKIQGTATFQDAAANTHLTIAESGTNASQFTAGGTDVFVLKDDTGIIMDDNMGTKNNVAQLANWTPGAGAGGVFQCQIVGYSKMQLINTNSLTGAGATVAEVLLPAGLAGMEYMIVYGSSQANITTFRIAPAAGEAIYDGSNVNANVVLNKTSQEVVHLVCAEAGAWTVVAHN